MTERPQNPHDIEADYLVDENGAHLNVPPEKEPINATHDEPSVGDIGPTNWWRIGLIGFVAFVALIMILQLATGGSVAPTQAPDPNAQFDVPSTEAPPSETAPATDAAPAAPPQQPAQ